MTKHIVVAIDGPAASGKGTLARNLAQSLTLAFLDTGALYRATALEIIKSGKDPEKEADAVAAAESLAQNLKQARTTSDILSNSDLRLPEVSETAATISSKKGVRDALFQLQRDFASNPGPGYKGAVLDGRDIGTVICPDADAKFFVTAKIEERARRRHKELQLSEKSVTYPDVLKQMQERDARDESRSLAPTRQAEDAILIDTSDLNADQVLETALGHMKEKHLI